MGVPMRWVQHLVRAVQGSDAADKRVHDHHRFRVKSPGERFIEQSFSYQLSQFERIDFNMNLRKSPIKVT